MEDGSINGNYWNVVSWYAPGAFWEPDFPLLHQRNKSELVELEIIRMEEDATLRVPTHFKSLPFAPYSVMGPDGKVYDFNFRFVFDNEGAGICIETIEECLELSDDPIQFEEENSNLIRLDFIPRVGVTSRMIKDIEYIDNTISQMEQGRYIPRS